MQHLQPGATLQGGKYRIEAVIGQGGFGYTYTAKDTMFGTQIVVIEFFMKGLAERNKMTGSVNVSNAANHGLFRQQMDLFMEQARRLRQSGNVIVHDMFEENGTAYYVTDYSGSIDNEETNVASTFSDDDATMMAPRYGNEQTHYASSNGAEETIVSSQTECKTNSVNVESYNSVPTKSSKTNVLLVFVAIIGIGILALLFFFKGDFDSGENNGNKVDTVYIKPTEVTNPVIRDTTTMKKEQLSTLQQEKKVDKEIPGVPPAPEYRKAKIEADLPEDFDDYLSGYEMADKPFYGYVVSSSDLDITTKEVIVQEEGTRVRTKFYINTDMMCQAYISWIPTVLVEGNKVKIKYYYSGNGGYRHVIEMQTLRR
ncbi:MAG: hypothetical protein II854_00985 [Prevotella sp.]|nr:hypothetical protein [Prevotella sp.]